MCSHCTVQITARQRADLHLEIAFGGSFQGYFGVAGDPQYCGKISVQHLIFQVVVIPTMYMVLTQRPVEMCAVGRHYGPCRLGTLSPFRFHVRSRW